jgi:hypothetical protein
VNPHGILQLLEERDQAKAEVERLREERDRFEFEAAGTAEQLGIVEKDRDRLVEALNNAQGCRTCDRCPDCGHLAHGSVEEIGHFPGCEIEEVLAGVSE